MSYEFYKVLHLTGIFMVFSAVGAHFLNGLNGGSKDFVGKKLVGLMHGIGLLVAFIAGFGLLARLGLGSWPGWLYLKILIWIFFGIVIILPRKKPEWTGAIWITTLLVGVAAAYLARFKPF